MSNSCHEEGLVSGIAPGGMVQVTVERGEAFGSCEMIGACRVLGRQKSELELVLENPVRAQPGDRVRITIQESAVVGASAVLYLVPAVCLILGAAAGYLLADARGWQVDPASSVGAVSGLVFGMFLSWLIGKKLSTRKIFTPTPTAVTHRPGSGAAGPGGGPRNGPANHHCQRGVRHPGSGDGAPGRDDG